MGANRQVYGLEKPKRQEHAKLEMPWKRGEASSVLVM